MSLAITILLVLFVVLLVIDIPIAFVLAAVTVVAAWALGYEQVLVTVASDMASGPESFTLLAIPFFILAGELLGAGGQARRLIDFASALVGRFPGGLAWVNTLTCMLFGAISGSAAAAVSSIGGTLIPEMNRKGYDRDFNIALTTSSATTGLLIPPSNVMIVYAVSMGNVSIAKLFMAGIIPGVLVGLMLMVISYVVSRKKGIVQGSTTSESVIKSGLMALPSLMLVVLVLGGIMAGIFTPTEASAIAVVWAFLLAVVFFREVKIVELKGIIYRAAKTTAVVLLLVAASRAMSQFLTTEQIPQMCSAALIGMSENPVVIILTINVLLLIVGIFMDMTPAVLIFTPILAPVTAALGIDPVHFGIIMITNLCIGLCTPPVGTCLFVGCSVGKGNIARVSRAMIPFYIAMIIALMLISFFEEISLWLPNTFG
ncbi:TRAP transporter large permease [Verrucomicrobiaceae bacterium N1E253]|uniref:TRAP transporter large permease n=1 Tax=Oceaniferula marina TaxID=2748318 RepID=A0A851GK39_9BACT|nr:TRAP transporter large permease [Oceaniferula marina]NWK55535.1 TRAP transporter large permease [Oceaniferula marina]